VASAVDLPFFSQKHEAVSETMIWHFGGHL
jgi:hypothetical protein